MAFKKVTDYNEERFGGLFLLRNDGDYADCIFLYRDIEDVLIAETHYIKSHDYNGYVHCCGNGCPACEKGIRTQTKLFIPLYNIHDKEIQFWDRSARFEQKLSADVFDRYPNPADFVFRITRHGAAGDINTTYEIRAVGRNTFKSYDEILAENNAKMPDYYENVCKNFSSADLRNRLMASTVESYGNGIGNYTSDLQDYKVTPRTTTNNVPQVDSVPEISGIEFTEEDMDYNVDDVDDIKF